MPKVPIGKVLRALRESLGLSLREAGEKADVDHSYLSRIEAGDSIPTLTTLGAIAEAYNTGVRRILKEAGIR